MDKAEAIELARRYKSVISERFADAEVYLYGSYSKGTAHKDSDIDVAVIVPKINSDRLASAAFLWKKVDDVSLLIEPVLMESNEHSPLYEDVMRTGTYI